MIDVTTEQSLYAQYPDLNRLSRVLRRSDGVFSLLFAECNLPKLRQQLSEELIKHTKPIPIKVDLSEMDFSKESKTIDEIITQQIEGGPEKSAVFLFGLEQLLPTLSSDKLRSTVQQLNWRRSNLAFLQRPLLIWLPRYALDLLSEQTPDFYDWYSGIYSFPANDEHRLQSELIAFQGLRSESGVHAADQMSSNGKKRWLGTLKELLQEHPEKDKQRASLLNNMGYLLKSMGDNKKALEFYRQSLNIQENIADMSGKGTTLNNISSIYASWGDFKASFSHLRKSLAIQQEVGNQSGEGITLNNMAANAYAMGDYETALKCFEQSLEIQQKIGDKSSEGATLSNISQIYDVRGDYDTALQYLEQALIIQQEIGDKAGEGITLNNLAQVYFERGDDEIALNYLKRSLIIQQEIGDKSGEGTTFNNLSQIYHKQGDFETALDYLNQSLEIRQVIGDKSGEGTTLNNISQIHDARGDYQTALGYLEQSLVIHKEISDKAGECLTRFNLGHTYSQNGDYQKAMKSWVDTYKIAKDIGHSRVLASLDKLANHLELEGGLSAWGESISKPAPSKKNL